MTSARVGVDITAKDVTAAAFMSATAKMQRFSNVANAALKGFASGFVSSALIKGLQATVDRMDQMNQAAQRMGVGVETLSRLEYAGRLADLSFEQLQGNANKLNKELGEIAAGRGGTGKDALKALGITAFDASGKLKGVDQIIADVAGKFSTFKDGASKSALAMALFGKSGSDMIPLLNGGAQAIREAEAESDRLGATMSGPAAQAAETFNDNIDRMKAFIQGTSQSIVSNFLPSLNALIDDFISSADAVDTSQKALSNWEQFMESARQKWISTKGEWNAGTAALTGYAEAYSLLFKGDFEGAGKAARGIIDNVSGAIANMHAEYNGTMQSVNRGGKSSLPRKEMPLFDAPVFGDAAPAKRQRKTPTDPRLAEAKRIFEDTRTPMEAHMGRVAALQKLLDKGFITQNTFNRGVEQSKVTLVSATGALHQFTATADDSFNALNSITDIFKTGITSAFDGLIDGTTSVKKAFADMGTSLLRDVTKLFAHRAIQQLFAPDNTFYGGGGGMFTNIVGGLFKNLPAFARGADNIPNDMVARVHKGEMIIPASGADALRSGGMGGGVTIVDNRTNAPAIQQERGQDGRLLMIINDAVDARMPQALKAQGLRPALKRRA
jgi:hypothetical protein